MSKYHYSAEKVFKVNVGGTLYTTTRSTLTKYEGSLIWRIFTGDMACPRDERGTYFLDRDGHVFRFILNYLRSDKLVVPQGYRDLDILKEEADHYGLEGLVREVDSLIALRKRRRRPRQRKKSSQSTGELHRLVERNGDLYLSDEGSDYFYD
ncbi:hypothetical protein ACJMK2_019466 [Sinanodonta woodiana]|uniref:BTB domain-containing protein n=1 Tax=Sinanodonta woodiana TaxID=1069815 RepID=A0ABD3UJA5_SINWO